MAKFSKNVITQVSGFDNPVISGELVWNQKTYWNLTLTSNGSNVDLTGATINAGRIKIAYPQQGVNPPQDFIIFLFFLVRSDGVIKV